MEMEERGISVASVGAFTVKRGTNVRRDETEVVGEALLCILTGQTLRGEVWGRKGKRGEEMGDPRDPGPAPP